MRFLPSTLINFFMVILLISATSGCSGKEKEVSKSIDDFPEAIDTLLILPVETHVTDDNTTTDGEKLNALTEGAEGLSTILKNRVEPRGNIIFLSRNRIESILGDYKGSELEIIRYLGRETEADAVMRSRIFRYIKRAGTKYSVSQPASVNFSHKLIHTSTGSILCQGQFDESQQALFSDLFSFFKASSRGFKWITADELLREGVEQIFKDCPYLNE